jgi:predicted lipoprotein
MSDATASTRTVRSGRNANRKRNRTIATVAVLAVLLVAMGLSTKVVGADSDLGAGPEAFSAEAWGAENFPTIQEGIAERAVPADELAAAILADPAAAGAEYGVDAGTGPEISTTFTGTVGAGQAGIYPVTVEGVPSDVLIRIQTGPAINGTDLRDATGTVEFGQFTNQIDYQDAASALNEQLKATVLDGIDTTALEGETVEVTGAFQLINPAGWLVTPSDLVVQ